jgi:hypothetical protein
MVMLSVSSAGTALSSESFSAGNSAPLERSICRVCGVIVGIEARSGIAEAESPFVRSIKIVCDGSRCASEADWAFTAVVISVNALAKMLNLERCRRMTLYQPHSRREIAHARRERDCNMRFMSAAANIYSASSFASCAHAIETHRAVSFYLPNVILNCNWLVTRYEHLPRADEIQVYAGEIAPEGSSRIAAPACASAHYKWHHGRNGPEKPADKHAHLAIFAPRHICQKKRVLCKELRTPNDADHRAKGFQARGRNASRSTLAIEPISGGPMEFIPLGMRVPAPQGRRRKHSLCEPRACRDQRLSSSP